MFCGQHSPGPLEVHADEDFAESRMGPVTMMTLFLASINTKCSVVRATRKLSDRQSSLVLTEQNQIETGIIMQFTTELSCNLLCGIVA